MNHDGTLVLQVLGNDVLTLGGAFLTAFKAMAVAAVMLFASSVVGADGIGDTHVSNGGGPGGSTPCGSIIAFADPVTGSLSADCENEGSTLLASITTSVLNSNTLPLTMQGLTCTSNLTTIGWTETNFTAGGVDSCTFTAPSETNATWIAIAKDGSNGINDGDCDLDDFLVGIPHGCDFTSKTVTGSFFKPGAPVGLSVNGIPSLITAPEPSSALLLLVGLGAGFPFLRRKLAR